MQIVNRLSPILLIILCLSFVFPGCQGKNKALVTAHMAVGELLVSTKNQTEILHTQGIIKEQTYQSIRTNWLRAQKSYLEASDLLETILDSDSADISVYAGLITQVSTILSDIALWQEEDNKK